MSGGQGPGRAVENTEKQSRLNSPYKINNDQNIQTNQLRRAFHTLLKDTGPYFLW